MKDVLVNLNKEVGVKGSMIVTRDGVVVAQEILPPLNGDMVAAIDTDLGIPKGARVTVRAFGRSVTVRIIDVCACAGERLIDLTSGAFRRLAPLEAGVIPVTIELASRIPRGTLPPTDAETER